MEFARIPFAQTGILAKFTTLFTPIPRKSLRREMVEADVMCMGMFLWWSGVFDCRLSREAFGKMVSQVCGECRERSND